LGRQLYGKLGRLDPINGPETDYYINGDWDIDGLKSDIRIVENVRRTNFFDVE